MRYIFPIGLLVLRYCPKPIYHSKYSTVYGRGMDRQTIATKILRSQSVRMYIGTLQLKVSLNKLQTNKDFATLF